MAENSSIEWCDHTFNPVRGCTKISPGCANCYAAREAKRFPGIRGVWGDAGTRVVAVPSAWNEPLRWNREAERRRVRELHSVPPGKPHAWQRPRVFCASLADIFEDWKGELRFPASIAPGGYTVARWDGRQLVRELDDSADRQGLEPATMDHVRQELFELIRLTPELDWLLLTKRPGNVMRMVPESWREEFPRNVWMGTTVEDQQRADERLPVLLSIPARVRFLSCEPLLGPVDLFSACFNDPDDSLEEKTRFGLNHRGLRFGADWVIAGGESGPGARPMHPDWARSLRDQCQAAGVPFLFKQWGEWCPGHNEALPMKTMGPGVILTRFGKKAAGRKLDGREWNEFPNP